MATLDDVIVVPYGQVYLEPGPAEPMGAQTVPGQTRTLDPPPPPPATPPTPTGSVAGGRILKQPHFGTGQPSQAKRQHHLSFISCIFTIY